MNDMLQIYRAENIWYYVTGQNGFAGTDAETDYYESALHFAELCSLEALSRASSTPDSRPLDEDFVNTYNQIARELLRDINSNFKISLMDIGNRIRHYGEFNEGVAAVCYGDSYGISTQYAPDGTPIEEYLQANNRVKITLDFARHLVGLKKMYGEQEVSGVFSNSKKFD